MKIDWRPANHLSLSTISAPLLIIYLFYFIGLGVAGVITWMDGWIYIPLWNDCSWAERQGKNMAILFMFLHTHVGTHVGMHSIPRFIAAPSKRVVIYCKWWRRAEEEERHGAGKGIGGGGGRGSWGSVPEEGCVIDRSVNVAASEEAFVILTTASTLAMDTLQTHQEASCFYTDEFCLYRWKLTHESGVWKGGRLKMVAE